MIGIASFKQFAAMNVKERAAEYCEVYIEDTTNVLILQ
jgi:hypothetical protein